MHSHRHDRTLQRAAAWPLVQRPYPRSMADLARWIMQDVEEGTLDEAVTAATD
jgi:hypothetical protein